MRDGMPSSPSFDAPSRHFSFSRALSRLQAQFDFSCNAHEDCLMQKGALYAQVEVSPGLLIDMFTTHLQASYVLRTTVFIAHVITWSTNTHLQASYVLLYALHTCAHEVLTHDGRR